MAKFKAELPNDLIKQFEKLGNNAEKMMGEMTKAGAEVTFELVKSNMKKSFKTTNSLEEGLKMTRVYKAPSKDSIGVYIGFYGYVKDSKPTKDFPRGIPIDLIAKAREYGTSSGEDKEPFFRKSFKKKVIEQAMLKVQGNYIKGD